MVREPYLYCNMLGRPRHTNSSSEKCTRLILTVLKKHIFSVIYETSVVVQAQY